MAEFEELKLSVTLDDQASQGLREIQHNLIAMGRGTDLNKLLNELRRLDSYIKDVNRNTESLSKSMRELGTQVRAAYREFIAWEVAIKGFGYAVYNFGERLSDFARKTVDIEVMARSIGMGAAQFKNVSDQLRQVGYEAGHADRAITNFWNTVTEANRAGSQAQMRILQNAANPEAVFALLQRWQTMADSGDFERPMMEAADAIRNTFQRTLARTGSRTQAAAAAKAFAEDIGSDMQAMDILNIGKMTEEQYRSWQRRSEAARGFRAEWEKTSTFVQDVISGITLQLTPALKEWNDKTKDAGEGWGKWIGQEIKKSIEDFKTIYNDLKEIYNWLAARETDVVNRLNEKQGPQAPSGWEWLKDWWKGGRDFRGNPIAQPQKFGELHPLEGLNIPEAGRSGIGDLSGGYSANIEDRREDQTSAMETLTNEVRRINNFLQGADAQRLGFLGTQMGGLGPGMGTGTGVANPMGRATGAPPGSSENPGAPPPGGLPPGSHGASGGPPATPYAPAGTAPVTLPGSVASPGYAPGGFTPVQDLTTASGQSSGSALGIDKLTAGANNRVDPTQLYQYLRNQFANSSLNGYVPPDGAKFGITKGTPEEWAAFGVAVAKQESGFNTRSYNASDPGGSAGLFQFGQGQTYLTKGTDQFNPQASADTFVRSVERFAKGKQGIGGMSITFGSIRRPHETTQHLPYAQRIAANAPRAPSSDAKFTTLKTRPDTTQETAVPSSLLDPTRMTPPTATAGGGGYAAPVTGTFSGGPASHFHAGRGGRLHSGVDIQANNKSPVSTVEGGTVTHVANHGGYGWTVDVRMPNGDVVRYGTHGSQPPVKAGDTVQKGQVIGTVGKGHLHMEVIKGDYYNQHGGNRGKFVSTSYYGRGPVPTHDPRQYFKIDPKTQLTRGGAFGPPPPVQTAGPGAGTTGGPRIETLKTTPDPNLTHFNPFGDQYSEKADEDGDIAAGKRGAPYLGGRAAGKGLPAPYLGGRTAGKGRIRPYGSQGLSAAEENEAAGRPFWQLDRSAMSKAEMTKVQSNGKVTVDVKSQDNPKDTGEKSLLKPVSVERKAQMEKTDASSTETMSGEE